MKCSVLATVLLGLGVVAWCGVAELPASDYINRAELLEDQAKFVATLRDFVEKYGSEDPEETAKLLRDLTENLRELIWYDNILDRDLLTKAEVGSDGRWTMLDFGRMLIIDNIVHRPETHCDGQQLDLFLGMIRMVFGDDLEGFASGKITHDTKLHAFLLHYSKIIVSHWLARSVQFRERDRSIEKFMETIVAHDMGPDYTEVDFINKARTMDLTKDDLDVPSLVSKLNQLVSPAYRFKPNQRLALRLLGICSGFSQIYGRDIQIYTWARLLIPEEVSKISSPAEDLPRLVEYWRICLPMIDLRTNKHVVANVRRNTSLGRRIKKFFRSKHSSDKN